MSASNLLSADDLDLIAMKGAPFEPRDDLAVRGPDGQVLLTLKGRQFYSHSCTRHGVSIDLTKVTTVAALGELEDALIDKAHEANEAELLRMLDAGEVPNHLRETLHEYFYGDSESWAAAARRRDELQAAGPNVVGVTFKRKGRDD